MPILRTQTLEGAARGVVTVRAPHELNDQEVAWLQDGLVNQPGFVNRRNGIPAVGTFNKQVVTNSGGTARPVGVVSTYDPDGNYRIAVLYWEVNGGLSGLWGSIYDSSFNFINRHLLLNLQTNVGVTGSVLSFTALNDGGVAIYAADKLNSKAHGTLVIWYGGCSTASSGTSGAVSFTCSTTQGDATIGGSAADVAKLSPGMVIQGVGVVRKILTATTVSLVKACLANNLSIARNAYHSQIPGTRHTDGLVSAAFGTTTVTGYGTKFKSAVDNVTTSYTAYIVSAVDGTTIATVTYGAGVTDTYFPSATVHRNASMEPYYLVVNDGFNLFGGPTNELGTFACPTDLGGLVANYAGFTGWANVPTYSGGTAVTSVRNLTTTNRVWIGGPINPNDVDTSMADGSFIDISSTGPADPDIVASGSSVGGWVFCKRRSTFAIVGDSLENFSPVKIADDGALGPQAICNYNGAAIWAGKQGIWMWDGTGAPVNLVKDTILPTYRQMASSVLPGDPSADAIDASQAKHPIRCFVHLDHLFVCFGSDVDTGVVYTGNATTPQKTQTIVMYLPTLACNFWSNFRVSGFLPPSPENTNGFALMISNANTYHLVNLNSIIDPDSVSAPRINDALVISTCAIGSAGVTPIFYMETKRYDLGDALNRKVWKGFAWEASFTNASQTAVMKLDYVAGLNPTGTTVVATFPDTLGVYKAQRVKFRARNQFLGFRLYEDTSTIFTRPTQMSLAPWQMMYKPGRPGAI